MRRKKMRRKKMRRTKMRRKKMRRKKMRRTNKRSSKRRYRWQRQSIDYKTTSLATDLLSPHSWSKTRSCSRLKNTSGQFNAPLSLLTPHSSRPSPSRIHPFAVSKASNKHPPPGPRRSILGTNPA